MVVVFQYLASRGGLRCLLLVLDVTLVCQDIIKRGWGTWRAPVPSACPGCSVDTARLSSDLARLSRRMQPLHPDTTMALVPDP